MPRRRPNGGLGRGKGIGAVSSPESPRSKSGRPMQLCPLKHCRDRRSVFSRRRRHYSPNDADSCVRLLASEEPQSLVRSDRHQRSGPARPRWTPGTLASGIRFAGLGDGPCPNHLRSGFRQHLECVGLRSNDLLRLAARAPLGPSRDAIRTDLTGRQLGRSRRSQESLNPTPSSGSPKPTRLRTSSPASGVPLLATAPTLDQFGLGLDHRLVRPGLVTP